MSSGEALSGRRSGRVSAGSDQSTFSIETEQLLAEVRETDVRADGAAGTAMRSGARRTAGVPQVRAAPGGNAIRLGVMPFRTVGRPATAFSSGLAEEITTAFSRFRRITCVRPGFGGRAGRRTAAADGTVAPAGPGFSASTAASRKGNEIRVVARLIDMRGSGEMSWGSSFDGLMPDVLNCRTGSHRKPPRRSRRKCWCGKGRRRRPAQKSIRPPTT